MKKKKSRVWMGLSLILLNSPLIAHASTLNMSENVSPENLSSTLQILIFLTFLTFLPSIVLTTTSFTRIVIIFSMLRSGLGTQTTPPNQVLIGLSLFLTLFTMTPVLNEIKTEAIDPYIAGEINYEEFMNEAKQPLQSFMLSHTRTNDLELFVELGNTEVPETVEELPLTTVVPAFIISELRTAFEMGFLIFIPFVLIDFIVSSVLMAMGMFMLPPSMISLPFKLLLFVMVDGWHLMVQTIAESFMR